MIDRWIALLRGINVSGKNLIPMVALRELASGLGWRDVRSYIQSGNLVFRSADCAAALEAQLEHAIHRQFDLRIPVLLRSAQQWCSVTGSNPFAEVSASEGNRVMLCLSKRPPAADADSALQARAAHGEQVVRRGDALWIYFPEGAGKSKLSPALMDRLIGSPVTARNWRTVTALQAMLD